MPIEAGGRQDALASADLLLPDLNNSLNYGRLLRTLLRTNLFYGMNMMQEYNTYSTFIVMEGGVQLKGFLSYNERGKYRRGGFYDVWERKHFGRDCI